MLAHYLLLSNSNAYVQKGSQIYFFKKGQTLEKV